MGGQGGESMGGQGGESVREPGGESVGKIVPRASLSPQTM